MRYQVVGKNHRVFRKGFGEFFERNLPEAQERHLIGGGFIVRAPLPKKKSQSAPANWLPAEPSVSSDAPSEAQEAPNDNPEGMSSSV